MDEPVSSQPAESEAGVEELEEEGEPAKDFLQEINCPEPGIIDRKMIETAYLEEGQKGEAKRLHQLEPVVYERINTMRLEFKSRCSKFCKYSLPKDVHPCPRHPSH